MAVGLPVIGTNVGGTPELLCAEDTVPPNDVGALADKLRKIITNPDRMYEMSERNLKTVRQYTDKELGRKRQAMYRFLREYMERQF